MTSLNHSTQGEKPAELSALIRVLLGLTPPSEKIPVQALTFFDGSLNSSQKEAVKFCLEAPEVACIHGPPGKMFFFQCNLIFYLNHRGVGTGKTHTLIEIIRQLTTATSANPHPKRLLVCGASNLSVDNILERLLALPVEGKAQRLKVTRIGHPARVMAHEGVLDATLEVKATKTDQVSSMNYLFRLAGLTIKGCAS